MAMDTLRSLAEPSPIGVDLGTGSGAIALAMATEVPHAQIYAVEKSSEALPWTSKNFSALGGNNAHLVPGDLAGDELLATFPHLEGTVAVIVSNPPYIPTDAIPRDPEVRLFDPELALYGGQDGMSVMHLVSATAKRLLIDGGELVVEHADSQSDQVCQLLLADGWRDVRAHQDLTGRDRAVTAKK